MEIKELIESCNRAIEKGSQLYLKMPGVWGKRKYARLNGRHGGPLGLIIADIEGGVMAIFDPEKVMAYLRKKAGE